MEKEFKKWTEKEVEQFCENNFIEDDEWLFKFVDTLEVHLDIDKDNDLIIIIKGDTGKKEEVKADSSQD